MKTRIGILAGALLVAGVALLGQASPSLAHDDACAGNGDATLTNVTNSSNTGFGVPQLHNQASATFSFNLGNGACVAKGLGGLRAGGTVTGWCGLSSGAGITNNGHSFVFTSVGTSLVVSGEVDGEVSAAEDPLDAGTCTNASATHFLITGAAVKHHCTAASNTQDSGPSKPRVRAWACV